MSFASPLFLWYFLPGLLLLYWVLPGRFRNVLVSVASLGLYAFGGEVIRGFTAAMLLGIVVGTYSSIYVSSSLLITLGLKPGFREEKPNAGSGAERVGPREGN